MGITALSMAQARAPSIDHRRGSVAEAGRSAWCGRPANALPLALRTVFNFSAWMPSATYFAAKSQYLKALERLQHLTWTAFWISTA